jgi:hypothetical protein
MPDKADLRVSIDADVKAALDALAKETRRAPGAIVEQALRLVLDPLPVLVQAQALLAAYRQERVILSDKINLLADTLIDRLRADEGEAQAAE